LADNQGRAVRS